MREPANRERIYISNVINFKIVSHHDAIILSWVSIRQVTPPRKSAFLNLRRDGPQDSKKNGMTKRKIEYWVIPPDQDAEFVADMENVLETYAQAYDQQHPVLCMDEQPV